MARKVKNSTLEFDEEIEFQEKDWKVQRIAWVIFAIVILLALLGLFGQGPLSDAEVTSTDGAVTLKYPRFARFQTEFALQFEVQEAASAGEEFRLQLNKEFLDRVEINTIAPEPDSEIESGDWTTYVFKTAGVQGPLTIHFYLSPEEFGVLPGGFRQENGNPASFTEFVYP